MEVVSYKCPNCSAPLSFDIGSQNWKCKFCGSEFDKDTIDKLDSQKTDEVTTEIPVKSDVDLQNEEYRNNAAVYICPSCGGKIVTTPTTAATFCIYCHNPTIVASRLDNDENRPAYLIPFKLNKETAVNILQNICKKRKFLPKDFKDYIAKGEISGLYVPYWLFEMNISAYLESRASRIKTWRGLEYLYTQTDTYQIKRSGEVTFKNIPADGSEKMQDSLMESLEPFDYEQMVDFRMEYLSGHFAEIHDTDVKIASERVFSRIYPNVRSMIRGSVQGYSAVHTENCNVYKNKVKYINVMMPVWVLMADYKGKNYTFAVNGQTGKIAGNLPIDNSLVFKRFMILGSVLSLIFFIGGMII